MLGSAGAGPHCERIVVSVPVLLAMTTTLKAVPGESQGDGNQHHRGDLVVLCSVREDA